MDELLFADNKSYFHVSVPDPVIPPRYSFDPVIPLSLQDFQYIHQIFFSYLLNELLQNTNHYLNNRNYLILLIFVGDIYSLLLSKLGMGRDIVSPFPRGRGRLKELLPEHFY